MHKEYLESALQTGLSPKAAAVYVAALEAGEAQSPKALIIRTGLHRQYVYDALCELEAKRLTTKESKGRKVKYRANSPDQLAREIEVKRLETLGAVRSLMMLYDRSPAGMVEVIRGSEECIESEFNMLRTTNVGDFLDIVGGAGMNFVKLFAGRIEEWEALRKEKNIALRYIGSGEDVVHNQNQSTIKNESRTIEGIGNIVNVAIRPDSVSFNIYAPEVVTVRVRNKEAVLSQKALFEILWQIAK